MWFDEEVRGHASEADAVSSRPFGRRRLQVKSATGLARHNTCSVQVEVAEHVAELASVIRRVDRVFTSTFRTFQRKHPPANCV